MVKIDAWSQIHYKIPLIISKYFNHEFLQYRISHRIIATNTCLFNIEYDDSDKCSFCNREKETIINTVSGIASLSIPFLLWEVLRKRDIQRCSEYILLLKCVSCNLSESKCFCHIKYIDIVIDMLYI